MSKVWQGDRKILEDGKKIFLTKGALLKDVIVSSRNVFIEIFVWIKNERLLHD